MLRNTLKKQRGEENWTQDGIGERVSIDSTAGFHIQHTEFALRLDHPKSASERQGHQVCCNLTIAVQDALCSCKNSDMFLGGARQDSKEGQDKVVRWTQAFQRVLEASQCPRNPVCKTSDSSPSILKQLLHMVVGRDLQKRKASLARRPAAS
jgi:hypothetical protein